MRVRYSPRSIEALDDIQRYISKDNPSGAWVVASFIRQTIRHLERWPYQGRATEKDGVRRIVVVNYPYVVYYHVNDERVLILTVMHTPRRIASSLRHAIEAGTAETVGLGSRERGDAAGGGRPNVTQRWLPSDSHHNAEFYCDKTQASDPLGYQQTTQLDPRWH